MTFRPPKKPALTLDATLVQDDLPLEVIPKVFIGSIHSAFNAESLHHNGITHILNASRLPITFPKQFTYLSVEIRDRDSSNILACIPTTNIFIEAGLEHGGVLVHCFGGKSRSAAFVCAYIMSTLGWSFDEAYSTLKAARPIVEINAGFECQLRAYYAASCDVYIAQQLLLRTRIRALQRTRQLNLQLLQNSLSQTQNAHEDSKHSPGDKRPSPPTVQIVPHNDYKGGVELSASSDSMEIDEPATPTTLRNTNLNAISINTSTHTNPVVSSHPHLLRDSHKYDSFTYGSASGFNRSDDSMQRYGTLHIPKLTTQSEDDAEYTFNKTRSISDVYTTGMDPCLENDSDTVHRNTTQHSTSNTRHDEDDTQTLRLLQQKHYIADSPSNSLHNTLNPSGSLTGLNGFGAMSTSNNNSSGNTGFRGLGMNLSISTGAGDSGTSNSGPGGLGLGGLGGLGLSLNTAPISIPSVSTAPTASTEGAPDSTAFTSSTADYHSGLGSTANSSSANFMQGSGSSSGNRTHRASAQANRHKAGATANGGGSRGRKSRSNNNDDAPPACRLSRPGSTAVRIIPPLRGLERQFLCSWCNTSLFTTANVLRTDLDLRVLLDEFVSSSGAALAAASNNSSGNVAGQGKFRQGGEEQHLLLIAQEKSRAGADSNANSIASSNTASPYHMLVDQQDAKSTAVSPAMRLHNHHNSHNSSLPAINPGSNASSPAHRLGEAKHSLNNSTSELSPKKGEAAATDLSKKESGASSSGRFPPITLNRSAQGSSSNLLSGSTNPHTLSRTSSATGMGLNAVHGNSNNVNNMEMDVDSTPAKQSYDQEELFPQPRAPPGGPRTSRATQSRAFDFDLPMLDTAVSVSPMKESSLGGIAEHHAHVHTSSTNSVGSTPTSHHAHNLFSEANSSRKTYPQDDLHLGTLSAEYADDSVVSHKGSGSRRGSGGGVGLPLLLHSKTTISNSSISSDGEGNSGNVASTSMGSNPGNPHNHPVLMSNSSPTLSHSDLTAAGSNNSAHPPDSGAALSLPHRLANLKVSTLGIASLDTSHGEQAALHSNLTDVHHHTDHKHYGTSPSGVNTARSEESPRIHIPPHRLQQYQNSVHSANGSSVNFAAVESPRSYTHLSQSQQAQLSQLYARPQSAEKRRWLERMNLLRNSSSQALLLAQHHTNSSGSSNYHSSGNTSTLSATAGGASSGVGGGEYVGSVALLGQSGDHKVARMADADVAASQLIYSGGEKYFHIEHLDWMGSAPLGGSASSAGEKNTPDKSAAGNTNASSAVGSDSGDICCPSCKNAVGVWLWNPSLKMTLGGALEAPLFKIHKHVVHQMDVQFDATPSSTPRVSDHQMHTD